MPLFRRDKPDDLMAAAAESVPAPELVVGRELGEARFELAQAEKRAADLARRLEAAERAAAAAQADAVRRTLDALAEALATPLAHVATQVALVRARATDLSADEVAATVSQLVAALEKGGIGLHGAVGDRVPFDPAFHLPLAGAPEPSTEVTVRSPAVLGFEGRVVRKATVEL
jgi:hypothetical protein